MAALTGLQTVPVTEMDVVPTVVTAVTVIRPLLIPRLSVPSSSETAVSSVWAKTPERRRTPGIILPLCRIVTH